MLQLHFALSIVLFLYVQKSSLDKKQKFSSEARKYIVYLLITFQSMFIVFSMIAMLLICAWNNYFISYNTAKSIVHNTQVILHFLSGA